MLIHRGQFGLGETEAIVYRLGTIDAVGSMKRLALGMVDTLCWESLGCVPC